MRVEIISISDELVRGEIDDRTGPVVCRALSSLGLTVRRVSLVGADEDAVAETLRAASATAQLIIVSGGLGEVHGELARRALTSAFGAAADDIETLPPCSGATSGLALESEELRVFLLPGSPVEMEGMLEGRVLPALSRLRGEALYTARLRVFGIAATEVREMLEKLVTPGARASLGRGAPEPEIEIVIRSRGQGRVAAARGARELAAKVCTELGHAVHGPQGETLSEAVGSALRSRGWSLSVVEDGTGGVLSAKIAQAPSSSTYFLAGLVSESADVRNELWGLAGAAGATKPAQLAFLAEQSRSRAGASLGLALSCVAGPKGGSPEEPVGLVHFALAGEAGTVQGARRFTGMDRAGVTEWAAATAMAALIDYCRKVAG